MEVILTEVQILDLFLRFVSVGQLVLLAMYLATNAHSRSMPNLLLMVCIIGYILLTAPSDNKHYGSLRHFLLLLTDLMPYAALWYTLTLVDNKYSLKDLSKFILLPIALWISGLAYFFLILGGRGILHDINHGLGMVILMAIIYICLSDYFDDLDNERRNKRMLLVSIVSLYMIGQVVFEFIFKEIRDTWQFSIVNAVVVLIAVSIIGSKVLLRSLKLQSVRISGRAGHQSNVNSNEKKQLAALKDLMDEGAFLQSELTITRLAEQLNIQVYLLRQLINRHLGYSNFSHYLNSYRIPWVCSQLKDKARLEPVLTIALEAGYGSIAPFNRAFKAQMGQTPTQFRAQFQNRS